MAASKSEHLVLTVEEEDLDAVNDTWILKLRVGVACALVYIVCFVFSSQDLDEKDRLGEPYSPVAPGDWVEIREDASGETQMRVLSHQKGDANAWEG